VQLRTALTTGLTILAMGIATTHAWAEPGSDPAPPDPTAISTPLVDAASFDLAKGRSIFGSAAVAAAQAPGLTTSTNEHQFGAGLRFGTLGSSVGASVRYFFYSGPLGVQGEVSGDNLDFGPTDYSTIQFSPSVLYRFIEQRANAPFSLVPYAGAGLSFIHTDFEGDPFFEEIDDTSVGVLLYGGVEFFFDKVPNLGASAELTFNSNDDLDFTIGTRSLGGVRFTAAGHWYFW
jgi:hypothetical protein